MSSLHDEVNELKKKMEQKAYDSAKTNARSWTGRTQHDLTALHKFFFQVVAACHWIWQNILRPISRFFFKPVLWLWKFYRILWDKAVYYEDKYQNRQFSKTRAGVFLAASLVFAWYCVVPITLFVFDAAVYFATVKRGEIVYLTNSQEIRPDDNEHSVQGCHALPCTDGNSVYYRIRATNFNEAWSILQGRGLFYPDYVAASVPVSISKCTITSYGFRIKLLMRGFDIYPDLLETKCTPLQDIAPISPEQ